MRLQFLRLALYLINESAAGCQIPDLVIRLESDPIGNGSVLFGLFAEDTIDSKSLERRLSRV